MLHRPTPRRYGTLAILLAAWGCATVPPPVPPVRMPAVLTEGGLFIVRPVIADGHVLPMVANTGSGPALIYPDVVRRLALPVDSIRVDASLRGQEPVWVQRVRMPAFRADAWIPAPLVDDHAGYLIVSERSRESVPEEAGYLGSSWFAMRTWTFDYARGELLLRTPGDLPRSNPAHRVRLGFRTEDGVRVEWLPRIRVQIAGEPVDLLLATGMDERVSEQALREMGLPGPSRQAFSSVESEVFDRWRAAHPEWRVIERAVDGGLQAIIEVPEVSVGGYTVGPAWFASGGNGAGWLSNWTDRPVQGFLGGNVLRFFRLSVDFDQGIAVFERP